ncbi:response regulator [Blastococcus saxobsidens]|uniref:Two component response regulator containing a CheY-like receiver domain and an HTH DNA-binding domain n=1 Tax=Blastococcus saxobsidens (strain DD2) TaxID=1146883 RepID=H6RV84_BLASD|nr:response regulator transcription factor [Blastococcus saxobsidens]CCG01961.1 Two component response regulator containing a CheY-like receiver domain and an HTH DNA-binding domain [Blastococcus saxobsidens DD2]
MTVRVVVADDQPMVRAGLRSLLEREDGVAVVGDARDGEDALTCIRRLEPDVVLMDIRMPVLDGLAATRRLVADGARTRVLVLTTFDLDEYVFDALRAGASGFLLKDATAEELLSAVRTIAAGEAVLAPSVTRRVIEAFGTAPRADPRLADRLAVLSPREVEVLRLLGRGRANAEIARDLVVSDATAKTHVSNVLTKLGLRDRVQAVIFACESGLLRTGEAAAPG